MADKFVFGFGSHAEGGSLYSFNPKSFFQSHKKQRGQCQGSSHRDEPKEIEWAIDIYRVCHGFGLTKRSDHFLLSLLTTFEA